MKKVFTNWFIVFTVFFPVLSIGEDIQTSRQTAITKAIEKVGSAVASITVKQLRPYTVSPFFNDPFFQFFFPDETMGYREVKSLGSGIVVSSDGYVLTNQHVVEGAEEVTVTLPGGEEYSAGIIGMDKTTDLAVLKIEGENFPFVSLGSSKDLIIGEWVIALGNPFGLFDINKRPTATVGIISSIDMDFGSDKSGRIFQDMIQTDAAINPGNSGGPLVNAKGDVIGINTFIYSGNSSAGGNIGIGFAIPIDKAKRIAEELKKYGKIDRSFITGLRVQSITRFIADNLNLPSVNGVIVTEVEAGGPASKAGIQIGDVILKVDGVSVNMRSEIIQVIEEEGKRAGDAVELEIYRDGKSQRISLKLGRE